MFILTSNGLTYLRSRFYNPRLGRFMTPDAIIPDWTSGQNWNPYAYVLNDPLNWVDPSGFERSWGEVIGDGAGVVWDGIKDIGRGIKQWWDAGGCDCEQAPDGLDTFKQNYWSAVGGGLQTWASAGGLGFSGPQMIYTVTQYNKSYSLYSNGSNHLATRPEWQKIGPYTKISPDYAAEAFKSGRYKSPSGLRAWEVSRSLRTNLGGTLKGGALGGVISAVGQGLYDAFEQPCLTHGERVMNILKAGGWGFVSALAGAVATATFLSLGAPAIAAGAIGYGLALLIGGRNPFPMATRTRSQ